MGNSSAVSAVRAIVEDCILFNVCPANAAQYITIFLKTNRPMENIENSHDWHMMEKSDGILEVTCLYRVYDDGTFLPCSYASLFVTILSNYGKGLFFCLLLKFTGLW